MLLYHDLILVIPLLFPRDIDHSLQPELPLYYFSQDEHNFLPMALDHLVLSYDQKYST